MTKLIAEIGSNHNQSFRRVQDLIQEAYVLGFWGVKFQLFDEHTIYRNPTKEQRDILKKRKLSVDFIPRIAEECIKFGLKFGITPFSEQAVTDIAGYTAPDFWKISSFDIRRSRLIDKIMRSSAPGDRVFVSLGLSVADDVQNVKIIMKKYKRLDDLTFFHCVSKYPMKPEEFFLSDIKDYMDGYSDHSVDADVICVAAAFKKLNYIELHFDLNDEKGLEFQHGHCWTPKKIIELKKVLDKYEMLCSNIRKREEPRDFSALANPGDGLRPFFTNTNSNFEKRFLIKKDS